MMELYSLGSSSRGNAFVIRTGPQIWLIDVGLSATAIRDALHEKGVSLSQLTGVWVTHEHGDHIRGLELLMRRTHVSAYITEPCLSASKLTLPAERIRFIHPGIEIIIGSTRIRVGSKAHDAVDPCFFTFSYKGKTASVITDLGHGDAEVETAIRESDALILESNHDEAMLKNGPYPAFLKRRIAGNQGHLSNRQAASLLLQNAGPGLQHVLLSHISERNNTPRKALDTIAESLPLWKHPREPILSVAPARGCSQTIHLATERDPEQVHRGQTGNLFTTGFAVGKSG